MKKITFLLLLAIPSAVLFPQSASNNLSFIHGVTLIVPAAIGCRSLGIRSDQVEEAAGAAARSAGWQIEEASDLVIVVSIDSVAQRESRLALRMEVRGGISSGSITGEGSGISTFFASRSFDAGKGDSSLVFRVAGELVSNVSQELHRDLMRVLLVRPTTASDFFQPYGCGNRF
jgi:hypothetical protein